MTRFRQGVCRSSNDPEFVTRLYNFFCERRLSWVARAIPLLLLIVVLSHGLIVHSQQASVPNPDYVTALWIAQSDRLSKVSVGDGKNLFNLPEKNLRSLAIDPKGGAVWTYSQGNLKAYSFDGTLKLSVPVIVPSGDHDKDEDKDGDEDKDDTKKKKSDKSDNKDNDNSNDKDDDKDDESGTKHAAVAVDHSDGSVWLALKKTLYHFDNQGVLLNTAVLEQNALKIQFDQVNRLAWVATKKGVSAYDVSFVEIVVLPLGKSPHVKDIAAGASTGQIWVGLKDEIQRYDATGIQTLVFRQKKVERLATNGQGHLWVATEKKLLRIDENGTVLFGMSPFDGEGDIKSMVADPSDGSVWLSRDKRLRQVSSESLILGEIKTAKSIHALALYTDIIEPELSISSPANDSYVNTNRPNIELVFSDVGIGVDPDTFEINADGSKLDITCSSATTSATCTPNLNLAEGLVSLSATVADFASNRSAPAVTSFTVDTIPPVITLTTPQDGLITNQPQLFFQGMLSEAADLSLNGQPVFIGLQHEFNYGPVNLAEGANVFGLVATDFASNVGQINRSVFLDTIAPVVTPPENLTIEATAVLTPVDLGIATALDNLSGSVAAQTTQSGPFDIGSHDIVWSAVDQAGNVGAAIQKLTVRDTTPPVLTVPEPVEVESNAPLAVEIGQATAVDIFTPVTISNDAPDLFPVGETIVTWTATDTNGNQSTATQGITVSKARSGGVWGSPEEIGQAINLPYNIIDQFSEYYVDVGVDVDGNAIVVWIQEEEGLYRVIASHYTVGIGWGPPNTISEGSSSISNLNIRVSENGTAIVYWAEFISIYGGRDWVSHFTDNGGWSEPEEVTEGELSQDIFDMAVDRYGNALAVFSERIPSENQVYPTHGVLYSRRYIVGEGWKGKQYITSKQSSSAPYGGGRLDYEFNYWPTIELDDHGNGLVVWQRAVHTIVQYNGQVPDYGDCPFLCVDIYSSYSQPGQGWGTPEPIVVYGKAGGGQSPTGRGISMIGNLNIDLDATGNAMAMWYFPGISAQRYRADQGWEPPQKVADGYRPAFAVSPKGDAIAVLKVVRGVSSDYVDSSSFILQAGWTEQLQADEPTPVLKPSLYPLVDMDAYGNAFMTRNNRNGYVRRYEPGDGWGPREFIMGDFESDATKLRMSARGNATVVWLHEKCELIFFNCKTFVMANHFTISAPKPIEPIAWAGNDFTIPENVETSLNGYRSADVDGLIQKYSWKQISGPTVSLGGAESLNPSFITPEVDDDTVLQFELTVTDNDFTTNSDIVEVLVVDYHADKDADGLSDGWEWEYFGSFDYNRDDDPDQDGTSNGDEFDQGTDPSTASLPATVVGVKAFSRDQAAKISWLSSDTTKYNIYWSTTPDLTKTSGNLIADATSSFLHTGLSNGTTYYYMVTATNLIGESKDSNIASATPIKSTASWGAPVLLETNDQGNAFSPVVATDSNGNGVAVWYQHDSVTYDIWTNIFTAGEGWGVASRLDIGDGPALQPSIVSDGKGRAFATWSQLDISVGFYRIYVSQYSHATGWSPPTAISGVDESVNPKSFALDALGNVAVVWNQTGASTGIFVNRLSVAQGWSGPEKISEPLSQSYDGMSIAANGQQGFLVAWKTFNTSLNRTEILSSEYLTGSGWTASEVRGLYEFFDVYQPSISGEPNGNAVLAWIDGEAGDSTTNVWVERYVPGSGWQAKELVTSGTIDSGYNSVRAAVDRFGNVLVTWGGYDNTSGLSQVFSKTYTQGVGWDGGNESWDSSLYGTAVPQFSLDSNGNGFAVWARASDWNITNLWARQYVRGDGWRVSEIIENNDLTSIYSGEIAVSDSGGAIAAWRQRDGSRENIWANTYSDEIGANLSPIADAGADQIVYEGSIVTLDASASSDPNGEIVEYRWVQTVGVAVTLDDPSSQTPKFTAPAVAVGQDLSFLVTVIDNQGAAGLAKTTITVRPEDTTSPVVTPPADIAVEATSVMSVIPLGVATAMDTIDGAIAPVASTTGPFSVGMHTVTWSATDRAGNVGTAIQKVIVTDTIAPIIAAPAAVTVESREPTEVSIGSAVATDIFSVTISNDAPALFPWGDTTVTWTATDTNGNSATATQLVTVTVPPPIRLMITSPVEGTSVPDSSVLVSGTVESSLNTSVTVNGQSAVINRSVSPMTFHAVVPLVPGANILTVTGTIQVGETDTKTVTVTRTGDTTPYTATVNTTKGLAALDVNFQVAKASAGSDPVYSIHVDFDGDGIVDQQFANVDMSDPLQPVFTPLDLSVPIAHRYTDPGVYPATVWVNNLSLLGSQFAQTGYRFDFVIDVLDKDNSGIFLTITSPVEGASIPEGSLRVTGTVASTQANMGVTVNGQVAVLNRGVSPMTYHAVVPLAPGANNLAVFGTTLSGEIHSKIVTVTRTSTTIPVSVRAESTSGIAPLNTTFQVAGSNSTPVISIHVDFDGDGTVDQAFVDVDTSNPLEPVFMPLDLSTPITHTYTSTGVTTATVWVNDLSLVDSKFVKAGYRFDFIIDVLDENALDALLTEMWTGMNSALLAGDVPQALKALTFKAKQKYQPIYEALLPHMAEIVPELSTLQKVSISPTVASYAVNQDVDGENRIVLIYFVIDKDGVWHLAAM